MTSCTYVIPGCPAVTLLVGSNRWSLVVQMLAEKGAKCTVLGFNSEKGRR